MTEGHIFSFYFVNPDFDPQFEGFDPENIVRILSFLTIWTMTRKMFEWKPKYIWM